MTFNIVDSDQKNGQPLVFNWTSVAFFAAVHALALLAPWFFSSSALGVAVFVYWFMPTQHPMNQSLNVRLFFG